MPEDSSKPKKTRKKRRAEPRESFIVRLEPQLFEQLKEVLKNSSKSRNDFVTELIATELRHLERFRALNTNPLADGDLVVDRRKR